MKTQKLLTFLAVLSGLPLARAQQQGALQSVPTNPPPAPSSLQPVVPQDAGRQVYNYEQIPLSGAPVLITPERAQGIIDRFKAAYPKLGSPRFLIYVNRELVDEQSGMKLTYRKEHVDSTLTKGSGTNESSTIKSASENNYRADEKAPPTLADRQTVRDVERLFGRPLRSAGAGLVDQRVAAELVADKPLNEFIGTTDSPQARKDREALQKVADAVVEVLISSKKIIVPTVAGDDTITVPDIQATAIRLSDSKILGQASSSDVTRRVPAPALRNFSVQQVTETTALVLMEDMMQDSK